MSGRLVAYVVTDGTLEPEAIRRALAERLPAHLVPSSIVPVAALPRTANGKVDRRALPVPVIASTTSSRREAAPVSKTQHEGGTQPHEAPSAPDTARLSTLWAEALNRPTVGLDENFFDLGGHSLTATVLVSRIRKAFAVELPLRALFEHPTIGELARVLEHAPRSKPPRDEVPLAALPRR